MDIENLKLSEYYANQTKGLANALILSKHLDIPTIVIDSLLNKYSTRYSQSRKYDQQPIKRIRYAAPEPGDVLHLDIMFLSKKNNDGPNKQLTPILVVVDTYSRYVWLFRQKTKTVVKENIQKVLADIYRFHGEKPVFILTDQGKEMTPLDSIKGVTWKHSKSQFGASIAEGTIARVRNLLSRLQNIQHANFTELAENLNTVNIPSVTKRAEATPKELFEGTKTRKQHRSRPAPNQKILTVGTRVRKIQNEELGLGEKYSQIPFFSKTIYTVTARRAYNGIYRYTLHEINELPPLKGSKEPRYQKIAQKRKYYVQELQPIPHDAHEEEEEETE